MKLAEVKKVLEDNHGYLVQFERCGDGMLRGDYFPDVQEGEDPFITQEEAIKIGKAFASVTKGKTCNFYLVRGDNFRPIGDWNLVNR